MENQKKKRDMSGKFLDDITARHITKTRKLKTLKKISDQLAGQ